MQIIKVIDNLKGFEKVDYQNGYTIFENKNFVPMGFSYDYYLDIDTFTKDKHSKG